MRPLMVFLGLLLAAPSAAALLQTADEGELAQGTLLCSGGGPATAAIVDTATVGTLEVVFDEAQECGLTSHTYALHQMGPLGGGNYDATGPTGSGIVVQCGRGELCNGSWGPYIWIDVDGLVWLYGTLR